MIGRWYPPWESPFRGSSPGFSCWAPMIAGLSGAVTAPFGSVALGMDIEIIIECFAVVVIGGMGSLPGTLLGSFIVGQVYAFGIMFMPNWPWPSSSW